MIITGYLLICSLCNTVLCSFHNSMWKHFGNMYHFQTLANLGYVSTLLLLLNLRVQVLMSRS